MEKKLKQTPHIVAFLDFLGASEKMRDPARSDDFLKTMQQIYGEVETFLCFNRSLSKSDQNHEINAKIFSDNIILFTEYSEENFVQKCQNLFWTCSIFQMYALAEKAPLRGAITCGKFCNTNLFVYGEALVRAYKLESKVANYPRIIIDKNIIAASKEIPQLDMYGANIKLLKQDIDGEWFIKLPFVISPSGDASSSSRMLQLMGQGIISAYKDSKLNETIKRKYSWLTKNFNEFCEENKLEQCKIPIDANGDLVSSEGEL